MGAASGATSDLLERVQRLEHERAGGLARARIAWRYFDGTFMPESVKDEARISEYERYATGGRARAARAKRATDGTFLME
jgi:hypothetical protein